SHTRWRVPFHCWIWTQRYPPEFTDGYLSRKALCFRVGHPGKLEEHGLVVTLEVNIEDESLSIPGGNQRLSAVAKCRQCRIVVKAWGVGEIDARVKLVEQPTSEHHDVDERCFVLVSCARLDRSEPVRANIIGRGASPAGESKWVTNQGPVLGGDVAVFIGLPDFDHRIGDRGAFPVIDGPDELNRPSVTWWHKMLAVFKG